MYYAYYTEGDPYGWDQYYALPPQVLQVDKTVESIVYRRRIASYIAVTRSYIAVA